MKINTIYESLSGEGGIIRQGTWLTFVRVQGCSLRCDWCDTPQALDHKQEATEMTVGDIERKIKTEHVLITGGEPLEQRELPDLLRHLNNLHYVVQVETAGHMPPVTDPSTAYWVVDYKCPSSGMVHRMPTLEQFVRQWEDFKYIVKLVVKDDGEDLKFATEAMRQMIVHGYPEQFLISPLNGRGESISAMAEAIRNVHKTLLDRTVFSLQIHKVVDLP